MRRDVRTAQNCLPHIEQWSSPCATSANARVFSQRALARSGSRRHRAMPQERQKEPPDNEERRPWNPHHSSSRLRLRTQNDLTRRRIASRQKPNSARPFSWKSGGILFASTGRITSHGTTRAVRPASGRSKTTGTKPKSKVTDAARRTTRTSPLPQTPRSPTSVFSSRMRRTSRAVRIQASGCRPRSGRGRRRGRWAP